MKARLAQPYFLAIALCGSLAIGEEAESGSNAIQTEDAFRETLAVRLDALKNVSVRFELQEDLTPPESVRSKFDDKGEFRDDGGTFVLITGSRISQCTFRFNEGCVRLEKQLRNASDQAAGTVWSESEIFSHSLDRAEWLRKSLPDDTHEYRGQIDKEMPFPRAIVDFGLGLREPEGEEFLALEDLGRHEVSFPDDHTALLKSKEPSGAIHTWSFDRNLGYALVSYEASLDGVIRYSIHNENFESHGGLMLPMRITVRRFSLEGNDVLEVSAEHARVVDYVVNDPENTADSFLITWPKGTQVLDVRLGKTIMVASGDRVLDDKTILAVTNSTLLKLQKASHEKHKKARKAGQKTRGK